VADQRPYVEAQIKSRASWFIIMAALSAVNSVLAVTGTNWRFFFGLGITQVVDEIAKQAGSAGMIVVIVVDALFIGLLMVFGYFAKKKSAAMFITGMVFYGLDGLLLLVFQDWLSAAVHGYALYRIYIGLAACREWVLLERAAGTPGELSQVKLD